MTQIKKSKFVVPNKATVGRIAPVTLQGIQPDRVPNKNYMKKTRA